MRKWLLAAAVPVVAALGVGAASLTAQGGKTTVIAEPRDDDREPDEDRVVRQFEFFGQREVQIGISVGDVGAGEAAGNTGARVEDVRSESPAAKAGIREDDVIAEFDGEKVRSARHLSRLVSETAPGRTVSATIVREGKRTTLQVTPESAAGGWSATFVPPPVRIERMPHLRIDPGMVERFEHRLDRDGWSEELLPDRGRRRLGLGVQGLTPQLAEYFGAREGVLVTTVDEKSPAAAAGLKAGDVITAVDGKAVSSPSELQRAVRGAADNAEVGITYLRDRKSAETKAKLPQREQPRRQTRPA